MREQRIGANRPGPLYVLKLERQRRQLHLKRG